MADDRNRSKDKRDNPGKNRGGRGRGSGGRRDQQRSGGRPGRGGQREHGGRGGQGGRKPAPKVEFEFLVATDKGSVAAPVYATDLPPMWREIPPVMFFKEGVFLRSQGAVKSLARKLAFDKAVLYVVWEDPSVRFRFGGQEVRPGVTAAMLVPSALDEGPPWIPIQANVESAQAEMESGFMSPALDQVSALEFKPAFRVQKNRLTVASDGPTTSNPDALGDTLRWLAQHPDDQSMSARVARTMLVRNGHGIQRFGVSLMHRTAEEKRKGIQDVLRPLAPEVADVIGPLWEIWEDPTVLRAQERHPALLTLAKALDRTLGKSAHLQSARGLATVTAWLSGLFGIRAEKSGRQPARLLYATLAALRECGQQLGALEHVDSPLPAVPFGRTETNSIIRSLSRIPREESNFERLVRALTVAECGWTIARPRREHLRPFRIVYPFVRGYPNAARSLVGRYDHVFTGWSFRGSELRDEGVKPDWFAGVFLTESPSVTSARAFARVAAIRSPTGDFVAEGLQSTDHPTLQAIGAFRGQDDSVVAATYAESLKHDKVTYLRLQQSVAAAEYLVARSESGDLDIKFALLAPHTPADGGVRGHFMYWRMFCRSIAWKLPDVYREFVDAVGPECSELPPKFQTELFALVRRWAMHSDEHRAHAASWTPWLRAAVERFFTAEDRTGMQGEWLDVLGAALATCDREGAVALLGRLAAEDSGLGHVERLLDGVRSAGWRRELVDDAAFASTHAALVSGTGAASTRARVEWTRSVVERSRHFDSVRWILDPRSYPGVVGSNEFGQWFEHRGAAAIDDADAAIVELLELAVRLAPASDLDMLLRVLDARTLWPSEEHVRALAELGRPEALIARFRLAMTGGDDEHATAVAALFERPGGVSLQRAGHALAHFATARYNDELTSVLADGLRGAYRQYEPHRYAKAGFRAACDGWIAAGLGAAEPAVRLANDASAIALESGDAALCGFAGYVADSLVLETLTPAIRAAVGGDDTALGVAFLSIATPEEMAQTFERAIEGGKSNHARSLRVALGGTTAGPRFDALVAGACLETITAGAAPSDLAARLMSLAQTGGATADNPNGDRAAQFAARRLETLAQHLTKAMKRWAGLVARIGEPGDESRALWQRAASFQPGEYRLRSELLAQIGGSRDDIRTVKDPRRLLTTHFLDSDSLTVDAADFAALADSLRKVVFGLGGDPTIIVDRQDIGVRVPADATAEAAAAELTPTEEQPGSAAAEPAAADDAETETPSPGPAAAGADEPPVAEVAGDGSDDAPESSAGDDADDDPSEAAPAEGMEPLADLSHGATAAPADEPSGTTGSTPAVEDEGSSSEAPTTSKAAQPEAAGGLTAKARQRALQDAYAVEATEAHRREMFGEPGVPVLLRHLAKRNGIKISFGKVRNGPGMALRWDRSRR